MASLRIASPNDDPVVIDHYLAVWESYGVPHEQFSAAARQSAQSFIAESRARWQGEAIVADDAGGAVGSIAYQLQIPPYPEVLRPDVRRVGYIWSVFVEPGARGKGIAREMVTLAVERLKSIGCTMVALHASDRGEPLYARLGFALAKEMRLRLR